MLFPRETKEWMGAKFEIYSTHENLPQFGGLYIFTNRSGMALYIGEAKNISKRLSTHEQWDNAISLGACQIHILKYENTLARAKVEKALIERYKPPLNTQYV